MALQEFVWVTVGIIWIHTYIRGIVLEHKTNDARHRSLSKASAILLVIWLGWQMVWWLSAFTFLNNEWFVSVHSNQPENPPLWWLISVNFGWSIGAIAISVLFIGEVFRSVKRGTSVESWIVFAIFFIGFMNWIQDYLLLDAYYSCIEEVVTRVQPTFLTSSTTSHRGCWFTSSNRCSWCTSWFNSRSSTFHRRRTGTSCAS